MTQDHQAFIEHKHKTKFNTSIDVVKGIIEDAVGSMPVEIKKIVKGESNEVYEFTLASGQSMILRLSSSLEDKFEKEKWVIEECAKVGVPVAKIVRVKSTQLSGSLLQISIQEKLSGLPLKEIDGILDPHNSDRLFSLLNKAGEILSKIHSVTLSGFGDISGNQHYNKNSIQEVLLDPYSTRDELIDLSEKAGVDPELVRSAIEQIKKEAVTYVLDTPSLLHCDYGPEHIFVQDDQITGIIDFENAAGGDPISDLARWDFFYGKQDPLEELKKGYANKSIFDEQFDRKIAIWKLHWGLGGLNYYIEQNNEHGINLAQSRLNEDMKFFQ